LFLYAALGETIWSQRYPDPTAGQITSISYGQGKFLATSLDGTLLSSTNDGNSWTPCTSPAEGDYLLSQYTDSFYILTDIISDLLFSPTGSCSDLTQWRVVEHSTVINQTTNTQVSPRPVPNGWDGGFVVVSDYYIYWSSSGHFSDFKRIEIDYDQFEAWSVARDGNKWVIKLGYLREKKTNEDSIYELYTMVVTNRTSFTQPASINFNSLSDFGLSFCTNANQFISSCIEGIITSPDGITWTLKTVTQDSLFRFESLECYGNRCVGIGHDAELYDTSNCGASFSRVVIDTVIPLQRNFPVLSSDGAFLVGTYHGAIYRSSSPDIWSNVGAPPSEFSFCDELIYVSDLFVMGCQNWVLTSPDGVNWNSHSYVLSGQLDSQLSSITGTTDDLLVAFADKNVLYSSTNQGKVWDKLVTLTAKTDDTITLTTMTYIESQYVALGRDTLPYNSGYEFFPIVVTSKDAGSWKIYATNAILYDITYSSKLSLWFGAGHNGIYSSSNLYKWDRVVESNGDCTQIASTATRVIAMCSNTVGTTVDHILQMSNDGGSTWSAMYSPCQTRVAQAAQIPNPHCSGLTYSDAFSGFLVYSENPAGLIYMTRDGSSWDEVSCPYALRIFDMAESPSLFMTLAKDAVYSGPPDHLSTDGKNPSTAYTQSTSSSGTDQYSIPPGLIAELGPGSSYFSASQGDDDGLGGGGIAGITIACIFVVVALSILLVVAFVVHRQRMRRQQYLNEQSKLLEAENDML